jgi:arylsulfatase A-like enzyme
LCSPTRSTFLTGRNHHLNGYASISEASTGFPGYSSHIPPENGTLAHVRPGLDGSTDSSAGETNQWYPDLAEDNHYIDQPHGREDGYHLSKDPADKAISFIRDSKQSEPDKPWYLWFCPGANHAPHHAPAEYIDKYKGIFDDGYEAYREWVLPRMIERGILAEGTGRTPLNPMAEGTFAPADAVRPGTACPMTRSGSSHGWRRCSPGSAGTPTPRWGGSSTTWRIPASWRTRSTSTAPTTAPPARAAPTVR